MTKPTDVTMRNRTGIKASPIDSKKTIEGAEEGIPSQLVRTDPEAMSEVRLDYAKTAPPVGTMPPPASVFLDQLGARLAFERTGTRIYEALMVKHAAASVHDGGPSRQDLIHIRDEELEHALLLARCIEQLGADPTAVTPAADIEAVASSGIVQVLGDPRTTLTQGLEAVLIAELADVDSWALLVDMAAGLGQEEMAEQFQVALSQEEEHLANVRQWVTSALLGQAGIEVAEEEAEEDEDEDEDTALHPPPTGRS